MAAKRTHKPQVAGGRVTGYKPDEAKRAEAETEAAVRERMEKTDLGAAAKKAAQARGEVPASKEAKKAPVAATEPVAPKVSDFMVRGKGIDRKALEAARAAYKKRLAAFRKSQSSPGVQGQRKALKDMK